MNLLKRQLSIAVFTAVGALGATFTVTNTSDTGAGSLRQAILDANANAGLDTIAFDIDSPFTATIAPQSPLPALTDPVVIDGYTQPGAVENDEADDDTAELFIELNGEDAGAGANGLRVTVSGCTIRGLVINNFGGAAIRLEADGNIVAGNFIGLADNGFFDEPNAVGVYVGGSSNVVGGLTPAARNVIGANTNNVWIAGPTATGNKVQGNFIGTEVNGFFALTDFGTGVRLDNVAGNLIGGSDAGARNVISGNGTGVLLTGTNATGNRIEANAIGVSASGSDTPNAVGVLISNAWGNTIGPSNVVAGNELVGIRLAAGAVSNVVQANLIGIVLADGGGSLPVPNQVGVELTGASDNLIGGTNQFDGNLISGNATHGLLVGPGATNNWIQGNCIGTDRDLVTTIANEGDGIHILGVQTLVGGTTSGAGNVIAFNGGNGITVSNGIHNTILANSIYTNAVLGIDLAGDGVTSNDLNDADLGPNNRQNFPVLTNASSCTGITIAGTLTSTSNTDFEVEFFVNDLCNPSGFGEGQVLIGWTNLVTDANGNAAFVAGYTNQVATGKRITATATETTQGDTSEFSACLEVDRVFCVNLTRPTDTNCQAVVAPSELDGGTLDPCGGPVTLAVSPVGPYPLGTNLVTVTATSTNGYTNSCVAQLVVVDQTPPVMVLPTEIIRTAGPLVTNRVTFFDSPAVTDNCSGASILCAPPSGSTFGIGTNTVTATATDGSGNSTNGTFRMIILPFGTAARDLAVVGMKMPAKIKLKATVPVLTKRVTVQIQNRGLQPETIPDLTALANFVTLRVESLGYCANITPVLLPPKAFPVVIKSKSKLSVNFNVTYTCASDPLQGAGHEDYRYKVTLNRAAIDGQPDGHPDDDYGPRFALPGGVDANPDGKIRDKGVGGKLPDKTLGGAVLTDVLVK